MPPDGKGATAGSAQRKIKINKVQRCCVAAVMLDFAVFFWGGRGNMTPDGRRATAGSAQRNIKINIQLLRIFCSNSTAAEVMYTHTEKRKAR